MNLDRMLVLGVDGGGSRSRAVLVRGGEVLARAEGGALNPNRVGEDGARKNLAGILGRLRDTALPGRFAVDAACIGLSGRSHPAIGSIVAGAAVAAGLSCPGPRLLLTDGELVLEAAFGASAPTGVALIAGTGSLALARDGRGRLVRAGGFGPVLGDEGGGHWIGIQALSAHLRAREGGTRTPLRVAIEAELGDEAAASVAAQVAAGTLRPAALAPLVTRVAAEGCAEAAEILQAAARELAALVGRAAALAGLAAGFDVGATGGVVAQSQQVADGLASELARIGAGPLRVIADVTPAAAALALRAARSGGDVPHDW